MIIKEGRASFPPYLQALSNKRQSPFDLWDQLNPSLLAPPMNAFLHEPREEECCNADHRKYSHGHGQSSPSTLWQQANNLHLHVHLSLEFHELYQTNGAKSVQKGREIVATMDQKLGRDMMMKGAKVCRNGSYGASIYRLGNQCTLRMGALKEGRVSRSSVHG